MIITPEQIRAARALLRLDEAELARRANVAPAVLASAEAGNGVGAEQTEAVEQISRVLEQAGVEFIERGVRRREQRPARTAEEQDTMLRQILELTAKSAAYLRNFPPLTDDEIYDENGLPR